MQTIQEQQKVIRRLLKKTNSSDSLKQPSVNSEDNNDLTGGQKIVLDYDIDNDDDDDNDNDDECAGSSGVSTTSFIIMIMMIMMIMIMMMIMMCPRPTL